MRFGLNFFFKDFDDATAQWFRSWQQIEHFIKFLHFLLWKFRESSEIYYWADDFSWSYIVFQYCQLTIFNTQFSTARNKKFWRKNNRWARIEKSTKRLLSKISIHLSISFRIAMVILIPIPMNILLLDTLHQIFFQYSRNREKAVWKRGESERIWRKKFHDLFLVHSSKLNFGC